MKRKPTSSMSLTWAAILAAGVGIAGLAACGGGGGGGGTTPPPPPIIVVTVSAPSVTLKIGESQTYTATVTGTSNTAVSWSVSGAGCTGAACGSITSAGVYTAPTIVPQPPGVTITATSQADTSKTGSATLTLGSDVALSVWPQAARVTVGNSRQFLSMLTGSSNVAVTWSVTGMGCTSANCGSVDASGRYTAPPLLPPGTTTAFVVATSVVDPGKAAQAAVTLQAQNANALSGGYAFMYRGVWADSAGHLAGRFTADGNGNLTAGTLDRTNALIVGGQPAGNLTNQGFTGGYSIDNDGRGYLSMTFPFGSVAYSIAVPASGERFFLQAFYDTSVRGTAIVLKQDLTPLTAATLFGNYVFQWTGADVNGVRMANIGRFTADGNGTLSAGLIDTNDGLSTVIDSRTFTGTYTVGSNGRGTMQIAVPGVGSFNFALYVVSGDTLIVSSIDDLAAGKPMRIGLALRQAAGPYSAASLAGNYVFDLIGRNSATSAIGTVGRLSFDGNGNAAGLYDRNDNYVMTPVSGQPIAATYTIDANGRGLLDATTMARAVFYVVNPDRALLMEAPNTRVQVGTLQRQTAAPYATAALRGAFATESSPPALPVSLTITAATAFDGAGLATSTIDIATPCALQSAAFASASYTVSPTTGRIDARVGGQQHAAGYLIDPVRYVLLMQRPSGGACDEVVHVVSAEQ